MSEHEEQQSGRGGRLGRGDERTELQKRWGVSQGVGQMLQSR